MAEIEMGYNNQAIYKKHKYIDIMIYRSNSEWFLLPTIIYGTSMKIYKPSISIACLRYHFVIYFNKR